MTSTEVRNERLKLMAARDIAVKNRDWALMDKLTQQLYNLPVPTARKS